MNTISPHLAVVRAQSDNASRGVSPSLWAFVWACVLTLAFALCMPSPAAAQETQSTYPQGRNLAQTNLAQEVQIQVEQFGLNNTVRVGAWTGVRLALTDNASSEPRTVAVRLHLQDGNGDTALHQRVVTLNPGRASGVWIYFRAPWDLAPSTQFDVTVRELSSQAREASRVDGGRVIAARRFQPRQAGSVQIIAPERGVVGVVGRWPMGLGEYALGETNNQQPMRVAHEPKRVLTGMTAGVGGLPDRWFGLDMFEVLFWGPGVGPAEVGDGLRARAVREWVHAGGHLVIVVPQVGEQWLSTMHGLSDIMPAVKPVRHEGIALEPYRWWLTSPEYVDLPLPDNVVIHSFDTDTAAVSSPVQRVITGPHGDVVVRRAVGAGLVTLIGLDPTVGKLRSTALRPDHFWHRIVGERFDTPTVRTQQDQNIAQGIGFGTTPIEAGRYVGAATARGAAAGIGVVLALILFAVYWVVAGPGGFALLKMRKWHHHAWSAFFVAIVAFTVLAWIGATTIRPKRAVADHMTVLTQVYGEPAQAMQTWCGLLLPFYGDATVAVGEVDVPPAAASVVSTWSSPNSEAATGLSFPDARSYIVDMNDLGAVRLPARATTQQFTAQYVGPPVWQTPIPTSDASRPRILSNGNLRAQLVHQLPAELTDVRIVVVQGQVDPQLTALQRLRGVQSPLPVQFVAQSVPAAWQPGQALHIDVELNTAGVREGGRKYLEGLKPRASLSVNPARIDSAFVNAAELMNWFTLVPQPAYGDALKGTNVASRVALRRAVVPGLDIADHVTAPVLVITGTLTGEMPTPVRWARGGGRQQPVDSQGVTVLRWVYPLSEAVGVTLPSAEEDWFVRNKVEIRALKAEQEAQKKTN